MKVKYDTIGIDYALKRKSDPRIATQIFNQLNGANRIINIGAGTGSYEPEEIDLIAVEPSLEMISQRSQNAHPVVESSAESLPFPDKSFSHALTVLSMHHWENWVLAFNEINRVASEKFVALTWNPEAKPFWLTRDYFPEIFETDRSIFPKLTEFYNHFDNVKIHPLLIPEDCVDGFLAAYWKRPLAYLDKNVRNSISSFAKLNNLSSGLTKLKSDIDSKTWFKKNQSLLSESELDAGYVIITGQTKNS